MCARFRDPAAQNYAIGDFAKKAGVSTHFLKFYEEKASFTPGCRRTATATMISGTPALCWSVSA